MTNLFDATATELATIALAYFDNDIKNRSDLDAYCESYESLTNALDSDLDDLLKNRNESLLFPPADELDETDAERFFDRIYRTPLFDSFIDELAKKITQKIDA